MKYLSFYFLICLGITFCTKNEANPEVFEGHYKTNALLDFRCIAIDPNKLPTLDIYKTGTNTYNLKLNIFEPIKSKVEFKSVSLIPKDDFIELTYDGKKIGDWKKNPFEQNKPRLVTVNYIDQSKPELNVFFIGEKN